MERQSLRNGNEIQRKTNNNGFKRQYQNDVGYVDVSGIWTHNVKWTKCRSLYVKGTASTLLHADGFCQVIYMFKMIRKHPINSGRIKPEIRFEIRTCSKVSQDVSGEMSKKYPLYYNQTSVFFIFFLSLFYGTLS